MAGLEEFKVLRLSWLLRIWVFGLMGYWMIAMIPKTDGDSTPLGQRPLSVLPVVYRIWASARVGQLDDWFKSWVPESVFSAGGGRGSVEAWYTSALDIEEVLSGAADSHVHLFVADVVKSFDTVDRGILDRVLSSLGLPGWFRHAYYFEYHAHVRLRFKLASGLGQSWTRVGRIPQGCPLSMMFTVALYLPWCRYLAAHEGVQPQFFADNLKCVSRDLDLLLSAARFTTRYVRLVGQEPAPGKCVLLSTSGEVRKDMKDWVLSQDGDRWTVRFDDRDLGGHLDTTFRGWSSTLAARVCLVISRLVLIFTLPLDFYGRVWVVRSMYLPAAQHGIDSIRKLRSSLFRVVWSRRRPFASVGAVLSLLDGPSLGVIPLFAWFGKGFACFGAILLFGLLRSVGFVVFWIWLARAVLDMVLFIFFWLVLLRLVLGGILLLLLGLGLVFLRLVIWPVQHFKAAILDAWRNKVSADLCSRRGFRGGPLLDVHGSLQLL